MHRLKRLQLASAAAAGAFVAIIIECLSKDKEDWLVVRITEIFISLGTGLEAPIWAVVFVIGVATFLVFVDDQINQLRASAYSGLAILSFLHVTPKDEGLDEPTATTMMGWFEDVAYAQPSPAAEKHSMIRIDVTGSKVEELSCILRARPSNQLIHRHRPRSATCQFEVGVGKYFVEISATGAAHQKVPLEVMNSGKIYSTQATLKPAGFFAHFLAPDEVSLEFNEQPLP